MKSAWPFPKASTELCRTHTDSFLFASFLSLILSSRSAKRREPKKLRLPGFRSGSKQAQDPQPVNPKPRTLGLHLEPLRSIAGEAGSLRSCAGCRSLGDKTYRHPEYMTRFFHSGQLVASGRAFWCTAFRVKGCHFSGAAIYFEDNPNPFPPNPPPPPPLVSKESLKIQTVLALGGFLSFVRSNMNSSGFRAQSHG